MVARGTKGRQPPFAVGTMLRIHCSKHPEGNQHIAMISGQRKAMDKTTPMSVILEKLAQTKASIRTKVELRLPQVLKWPQPSDHAPVVATLID